MNIKIMNSRDIRKKFQNYFTSQGHTWVSSASLISEDSSLLFTNAGMNPFKDYFLGLKSPPAEQMCSIQKCLRAGGKHNDLEEVGYSPYHHTFFEMIGSFSFGSYFKEQAIDYAMSFLTKELSLSKDCLWVSVFKEDTESFNFWRKSQQIPKEKIFVLDEKDNFWRMGETGPCGPCSEIYYYEGDKKNPAPEDMTEIWNLVFMEFNEDHNGKKTPLPKPCIDTGMGMERLAAVLQGEKSNYHTDLFKKIIKSLEEASGVRYNFTQNSLAEDQTAFRVIADHSRAISFLICDGVLPGSEGDSYVLRRILRRALFYSHKLKLNKNLLSVAAKQVIHLMKEIYPELSEEKEIIDSTIKWETELFTERLQQGKSILLQKIKNLSDKNIPDPIVWGLYSTYGFPPDLTRLIAEEKGFTVSENFNLEEFKDKQKLAIKKRSAIEAIDEFIKQFNPKDYNLKETDKFKETVFTGYETDKEQTEITHLLFIKTPLGDPTIDDKVYSFAHNRPVLLSSIKKEGNKFKITIIPKQHQSLPLIPTIEEEITEKKGELWIITNKSCFYPEGGGPTGDKGKVETETSKGTIKDCQKIKGCVHKVENLEGEIKRNQTCTLQVDKNHRRLIKTSHSATHLLHWALREILSTSVRQKGSLVEPGKLRFDFSYPKPLSPNQLQEIENKVIEQIESQHPVSDATYLYKEARSKGALFLAGENYEEKVRTIKMGNSFELCGGIHVEKTSDIGQFKIVSETGVQSGVRRITAYTSDISDKLFTLLEKQNKKLRAYLKLLPVPNPPETINPFIFDLKKKDEEIKQLKHKIKTFLLKAGSEQTKATKGKNNILTKTGNDFFNPVKSERETSKEQNFLARQNEELRKYLKQALPKDFKESENYLLSFFEKKEDEILSLKKQLENLSSSANLSELKKAKAFQYQDIKGYLLTLALPIEDRKMLAEMADHLKSKLSSPAIVVVLGEEKGQYPLVITISKELQKHISAGEILKNTIAPFLEGKGGGQPRFAQGTIKKKDRFPELEKVLLEKIQRD